MVAPKDMLAEKTITVTKEIMKRILYSLQGPPLRYE